jgi:predicted nucleotidyltransferase
VELRTWTVTEIQRAVDEHRSDLTKLGVDSLAVFGSVARGEATSESDIDFLVEFTGSATLSRYMELKLLLERLFGRKVDLVTRKSLRSRIQPFVEKDAVRVA